MYIVLPQSCTVHDQLVSQKRKGCNFIESCMYDRLVMHKCTKMVTMQLFLCQKRALATLIFLLYFSHFLLVCYVILFMLIFLVIHQIL